MSKTTETSKKPAIKEVKKASDREQQPATSGTISTGGNGGTAKPSESKGDTAVKAPEDKAKQPDSGMGVHPDPASSDTSSAISVEVDLPPVEPTQPKVFEQTTLFNNAPPAEPDPAVIKRNRLYAEREQFITDMMETITNTMVDRINHMPEEWDGAYLRQYIVESVALGVQPRGGLKGPQLKKYRKDVDARPL